MFKYYKWIYLSIYLSIHLSIYLSIYQAVYPGESGYAQETGGYLSNLRESTNIDKVSKIVINIQYIGTYYLHVDIHVYFIFIFLFFNRTFL